MQPKYLTIEQASELTQITVKTLRKKIRLGELRAYKPAKRLLILPGELDIFIKKAIV